MTRLILLALAGELFTAGCFSARGEVFIEKGVSQWSIFVPSSANPTELFAAQELSRYLKRMTGAELPIVRKATNGEKILIVGCKIPEELKARPAITGEHPAATLEAAYRFLDELGCRFLAPDFNFYAGEAEIVPKLEKAGLPQVAAARKKPLAFRKLYVEEGHSHNLKNVREMIEWMPKVGYNTLVVPLDYNNTGRVKWDHWREALTPELQKRGIIIEVGGHGYQNFLHAQMENGTLFSTHPEWFAQDKNGKRQKGKTWVFCSSNPNAVAYLSSNFLAYVKQRPEIQIFDFWPPDGARWCECPPCKALGSPADRQSLLLGTVREKVRSVRNDLRLEIIAYATYINPPGTPIPTDVLVDFCPISQHFDEPIHEPNSKNAYYADALRQWRTRFSGDISIYSYYRKYAWDSLPVVLPHYMQEDLKWYSTLPIQGVSTYSEPGDWFTYELNHYVLAALAVDVQADVDVLVKKFCLGRYGEDASLALEAFTTLEKLTRTFCSIPHVPLKKAEQIGAAKMEMEALLNRLSERGGSTKMSLKRLALMCEYAVKDLEIQSLRATGTAPSQIRGKAAALHAWLVEHSDEGVFLLNHRRLTLKRVMTRYGVAEP